MLCLSTVLHRFEITFIFLIFHKLRKERRKEGRKGKMKEGRKEGRETAAM
jgi:hypothetical protein